MTKPNVQFVFTTNHVANIDQRLLSRAHLCHINGGTQKDMLTLAQHVIQTEGVTATDFELNNHVQKAKGNVRDLLNNLEAFVLLQRKKTARSVSAAVPAVSILPMQPTVQPQTPNAAPDANVQPASTAQPTS